MRLAQLSALMMMAASTLLSTAYADCGRACCSLCGTKVCVLEVSKDKEEVTRFDVESKEICIPGIKFPWDKCGTRRCGGVRNICVLKEVKQEQTVCNYDWKIKTICTTCCQRHGLKHHHAQVNRDQRIPYEYYAAEPAEQLPPAPVGPVSELPVFPSASLPALPAARPIVPVPTKVTAASVESECSSSGPFSIQSIRAASANFLKGIYK